MEREVNLLRRQVGGLQEDNERINRMYQVIEKDSVFVSSGKQQENIQTTANTGLYHLMSDENKSTMRVGGGLVGKWKTVDDDNYPGNFNYQQFNQGNELGGPTAKRGVLGMNNEVNY